MGTPRLRGMTLRSVGGLATARRRLWVGAFCNTREICAPLCTKGPLRIAAPSYGLRFDFISAVSGARRTRIYQSNPHDLSSKVSYPPLAASQAGPPFAVTRRCRHSPPDRRRIRQKSCSGGPSKSAATAPLCFHAPAPNPKPPLQIGGPSRNLDGAKV